MACKYKYNNQWYSKEELQNILYKERGIDKYGKLVKPEIKTKERGIKKYSLEVDGVKQGYFDTKEEAERIGKLAEQTGVDYLIKEVFVSQGIQPTQTKDNLKTQIQDIKIDLDGKQGDFVTIELASTMAGMPLENDGYMLNDYSGKYLPTELTKKLYDTYEEASAAWENYQKQNPNKSKEYTSQALINTKIAALKEVAKKYPRSLIRSEVKRINTSSSQELYDQFGADELPFQKVSKDTQELFDKIMNTPSRVIDEKIKNCL